MLTTFVALLAPLVSLQVLLVVTLADSLTNGAETRSAVGAATRRAQAA
ncbi:hypothetical protein [uncultured Methylobacterium sp.]